MPKQSYAFEPGGEKRLTIAWKGAYAYKDFTVTLDNSILGVIPDQKALSSGQEFRLLDGSILKVQLVKKFTANEVQVLHNGQPLPGSSSDPHAKLKNAAYMVFFIGGLNFFLGIITLLFDIEFLRALGVGFFSTIFGLVFLLLGFFVWRRSSIALILAIAIFALYGLLALFISVSGGYNPGIGGLLARFLFLIPMIQGVGAIKTLKAGNAHNALP